MGRRTRCIFRKLGINKTTIAPFIDKRFHYVIFIEDLTKIEKIISHVINENYSKKFE